jgi:receptor expression-enhancing protein 5/6
MEKIEQIAQQMKLGQFTQNNYIKVFAEKSKLQPVVIVFFHVVLVLLGLVSTTIGRALVEALLLFFYPAYKSFEALKTEATYDDRRWLTYWVVFGFFYSFDSGLSFITSRIPFWSVIRIALLIWVMHPACGGAELIYTRAIRPVLDQYDEKIDKYLDNAEQHLDQFATKAKQKTAETISKNLMKTD